MNTLQSLLTPEFWLALYHEGQWGPSGNGNIFLLILVRMAAAVLILFIARMFAVFVRRIVVRCLSSAIVRTRDDSRRLTTLQGVLLSAISYSIYFIAIIFILFAVGVSWKGLAPLLSAASVLGLAVGFGAQKLIKDIITGLFILGEGQFDVGDTVTIGSVTGRVDEIGLRVTRLRDEQGRVVTIANGDITQVFNASRGLVKVILDLGVQRSASLEPSLAFIQQCIDDVCTEWQLSSPPDAYQPSIVVAGIDSAKVTIQIILWAPVQHQASLEDALRRRILNEVSRQHAELVLA